MDESKTGTLSRIDCTSAVDLCDSMAQYYASDEDRKQALIQFLRDHFPSTDIASDIGSVITIEKGVYLGCKNETASAIGDAFAECVSCYFQDLSCATVLLTPSPAYILEVLGPNLIVSGIVFGEHIYINQLGPPISLVPNPHNSRAMAHVARVLRAVTHAIYRLGVYYDELPAAPSPRFPVYQSYPENEENVRIAYDHQLKPHLFHGRVGRDEVVVKFTETYSRKAHVVLEAKKYAPKLYWCGPVSSRFKMVVMEFVRGEPFMEYLKQHPDKIKQTISMCKSALKCLHVRNLCHGNFHHRNVLVREDGRICVLGFDCAGVLGKARYPLLLDHNTAWPTGIRGGELITMDNDTFWIRLLDDVFNI